MSVVVRMEMPEDCRTCPFSTSCSFCEGYSDYCVLAPDGTKCEWSFMDGEFPTERPSWCPIICSLPEGHGRLVDADEIPRFASGGVYTAYHFIEAIADTPTIVPAEAERSEKCLD